MGAGGCLWRGEYSAWRAGHFGAELHKLVSGGRTIDRLVGGGLGAWSMGMGACLFRLGHAGSFGGVGVRA